MRTRIFWSFVIVVVLLASPAVAGNRFGIFAGVNIANMAVARDGGTALMAVSFDDAPPSDVVAGCGSPLAR